MCFKCFRLATLSTNLVSFIAFIWTVVCILNEDLHLLSFKTTFKLSTLETDSALINLQTFIHISFKYVYIVEYLCS